MYLEVPPSPPLRPWIETYWIRDGGAAVSHRVLPDGAADVIFELDRADAFAVGTMTRSVIVGAEVGAQLFGVRFRPGRAVAFLQMPLVELTDLRVPARDVWNVTTVSERMALAPDTAARVAILDEVFLRRLAGAPTLDPRIDAAVARIVTRGGAEPVERVAAAIGITRQHLARRFLHAVGVSPKTFARVIRFRALVDAIDRGELDSWADAAVAHGYYDQSHLIAEFRSLAGVTPSEFQLWRSAGFQPAGPPPSRRRWQAGCRRTGRQDAGAP